MMQSLIAWLDECSWHQLSTIAQSWTAPVSVLSHSWPTFSFSTSSVFPLHFAMSRIFCFVQCPKRQGGVNNFVVALIYTKKGWSIFPTKAILERFFCTKNFKQKTHQIKFFDQARFAQKQKAVPLSAAKRKPQPLPVIGSNKTKRKPSASGIQGIITRENKKKQPRRVRKTDIFLPKNPPWNSKRKKVSKICNKFCSDEGGGEENEAPCVHKRRPTDEKTL